MSAGDSLASVLRSMTRPDENGCLEWTGRMTPNGYGQTTFMGARLSTHRLAYELANGPIPEGLQIDHLCRNRLCANAEHMEAVPQRTNVLRGVGPTAINAAKTHCPQGHPYDEANTYRDGNGWRYCRACGGRPLAGEVRTHCNNGHEMDEANVYRRPAGWRECRTCRSDRRRAARVAS